MFLLSWDCYGLEHIEDITRLERNVMWDTLKGNEIKMPFSLNALVLRARFNPQRHYEIYTVITAKSITKDDLITAFKDNPQGIAEMIRERGRKIYSDRETTERAIK